MHNSLCMIMKFLMFKKEATLNLMHSFQSYSTSRSRIYCYSICCRNYKCNHTNNVGAGYTVSSLDVRFSAPKSIGVGVGTTATATAPLQMVKFLQLQSPILDLVTLQPIHHRQLLKY